MGRPSLLALVVCLGAACGPAEGPADAGPGADAGSGCTPGAANCTCASPPKRCGTDLVCRSGKCEACVFGTSGCPCADGACTGGSVCDAVAATCREPTACEDAGCAQHQACEQPAGQDAACLDSCEAGYTWSAGDRRCTATPSCSPTAPGTLVQECLEQGRRCDDANGPPKCGGCAEGFLALEDACVEASCAGLDCEGRLGRTCIPGVEPSCGDCLDTRVFDLSTGRCVDRVTCAETTCESTETCEEATPEADAACVVPGCPLGQVEASPGVCVDCASCYDHSGATPVPFAGVAGVGNGGKAYENLCVCRLKPGYFQTLATGEVQPCDGDGDGWVTDLLLPVLARSDGNNPLAREQKCSVRRVSRFELKSDDASQPGVAATKVVTLDELAAAYELPPTSWRVDEFGQKYVELVEPDVLDDPDRFRNRYQSTDPRLHLRPYGAGTSGGEGSHQLTAAEANPLTKACNHDDDDLNLDSLADVAQAHDAPAAPFAEGAQILAPTPVFHRMAYFLELDRGWYRAGASSECTDGLPCHGTFVIAEKSRAAGPTDPLGLELTYSGAGTYWQTCSRSRDAAYPGSEDDLLAVNFDFARWTDECPASGGCLVSGGGRPSHHAYDGRSPATGASHAGAADTRSDGSPRFPGMNHHSQFKCVTRSPLPTSPAPSDVFRRVAGAPRTNTSPSGAYDLLSCSVGEAPREADPPPAGQLPANPADPRFVCTPAATQDAVAALDAAEGYNHWAALRYQNYSTPAQYQRGCVNESVEWAFLCLDTPGRNPDDAFGELLCGCGINNGGADCDLGCPDDRVLPEVGYVAGSRKGWWLCGSAARAAGSFEETGGGYRLRGAVPSAAVPLSPACESGNCAQGYSLSPSRQP